MMQVGQAYALLQQALEAVVKAHWLMIEDWQWHRPDGGGKLPTAYEAHLVKARDGVRAALSDAYWTQNALRRTSEGGSKANENINS